MLTDFVAPAAIPNGKVGPVTPNAAPVVLAEKTVTLELPVFDRVAVWVAVFPVSTLPNDRLVGETLSRNVGAAVAVAESVTTGAVLDALLTRVTLPVNVPAACGAN